MDSDITRSILQLGKRAEKYTSEELVETFVDVGHLFTLLESPDHQILYGRRGTGKTHILNYLTSKIVNNGHCAVNIDLRNIGSTGGIYSDHTIPVPERATRLLVDTLNVIHDKILDFILVNSEKYNLSTFGPLLDNIADAVSQVQILGPVAEEIASENTIGKNTSSSFTASEKGVSFSAGVNRTSTDLNKIRRSISGQEVHRVHFPSIQILFKRLIELFESVEIWIVLDEWAEVPLDLQPYLGDLFRRTLFPLSGITIKIGAIEHRSHFQLMKTTAEYIGIEVGAEVTDLNLDEFMVFDNNEYSALNFFKNLFFKHVNSALPSEKKWQFSDEFVNSTFTQQNVFEEFVRSTEGVPRDAINILTNAAIKVDVAVTSKISMKNIRDAARVWYNRDKEKSVSYNPQALQLLRWKIDEVIGNRNARAFLLSTETKDDLIDYLYDARVIHLIKESISGKDVPGHRYNVYSIDYGAYVELINTTKAPKGLFEAETDEGDSEFINVPSNDYRAIRRAILNLNEFYESQSL